MAPLFKDNLGVDIGLWRKRITTMTGNATAKLATASVQALHDKWIVQPWAPANLKLVLI